MPIPDPAQPYFKDGIWAWDGSAWRKLPLLWGYSDRWVQAVDGEASGTGDASVSTTAVEPGYIHVLQAAHASHDAGVAKSLAYYLYDGSTYLALFHNPAAVSGTHYPWTGEVVLEEGEVVYAEAIAPGNTKKVFLRVWGYKMQINQ